MEMRVLWLLAVAPRSKAELSRGLGQKEISGQLNKIVRQLLTNLMIEYTIPEKPGSRYQKYRLTEKGRAALEPGSGEDMQ
ncbi:MAG: ATP-dependent DNA helicase [Methanomicrobiales archaeon HGW-Methanomicrobiales-2]|nr:MAG: ATP-dependent DNA helicase [Methanomicrobiales archaeon HGW-Methanomicrobiales-2]